MFCPFPVQSANASDILRRSFWYLQKNGVPFSELVLGFGEWPHLDTELLSKVCTGPLLDIPVRVCNVVFSGSVGLLFYPCRDAMGQSSGDEDEEAKHFSTQTFREPLHLPR